MVLNSSWCQIMRLGASRQTAAGRVVLKVKPELVRRDRIEIAFNPIGVRGQLDLSGVAKSSRGPVWFGQEFWGGSPNSSDQNREQPILRVRKVSLHPIVKSRFHTLARGSTYSYFCIWIFGHGGRGGV